MIFHLTSERYHGNDFVENFLKEKNLPLPTGKVFHLLYPVDDVIGLQIRYWGEYIFTAFNLSHVDGDEYRYMRGWNFGNRIEAKNKMEVPNDFKVEIIGDVFLKDVEQENPAYTEWIRKYNYSFGYDRTRLGTRPVQRITGPSTYRKVIGYKSVDSYGYRRDEIYEYKNYFYLNVKITAGELIESVELKLPQPIWGGEIDLDNSPEDHKVTMYGSFYGQKMTYHSDFGYQSEYDDWSIFQSLLQLPCKQGRDKLWEKFLNYQLGRIKLNEAGIKAAKNHKEVRPVLSKLEVTEPVLFKFFQWLQDAKVSNKVSNNSLLAAVLLSIGKDYDALVAAIKAVMREVEEKSKGLGRGYHWSLEVPEDQRPVSFDRDRRAICLFFAASKEKDNTRREKHEWYLRKSNGEKAQGLGVEPDKHPKFYAAVSEGKIPLSVFHNPGKELELTNIEHDLWERAFNREGWAEVLSSIANNASRRSTYDKKITPYISFLFKIESYLNKHVPGEKPWKAMPKFVSTQWELEMEEVEEGKTAKRRSALTPLADNEARTITVPYAGIAVHGRQTTYCYSNEYYVFEENMVDPEGGGVVVRDLEIGLNGRDDYGLMFYTLDGTPRNQGYPTFLIIFERRKTGAFVHFHRVHPNRYKNGIPTPACRLIEECYRYMAGNVRAEEICGQQGDLIFIKTDSSSAQQEEKKAILDFESHAFVAKDKSPVYLSGNTNKSIGNRLGFVHASHGFEVQHPEHEWLSFPAGTYEVRRCKSYENNPVAVWSYTID